MNEGFTLGTPELHEHPKLLQIWESSVRATHHFLTEEDIAFYKKTIQDGRFSEQLPITVYKDATQAIQGFIGTSADTVEMLFINPDQRGKGIGKKLLLHALRNPKIKKVDVNEQNEAALQFYQHFGFRVVERSPVDATGKPYPILHMCLS